MAAKNEALPIDPDLQEARRRLARWGDWLRAVTVRTLGYPTQAAFARERTGTLVDYDDPEAEEIESLLSRMMQMPSRVVQYQVLVQEYHFLANSRDGCRRVRDAKGRALNKDSYMHERNKAEEYLAGVLAGRREVGDAL